MKTKDKIELVKVRWKLEIVMDYAQKYNSKMPAIRHSMLGA